MTASMRPDDGQAQAIGSIQVLSARLKAVEEQEARLAAANNFRAGDRVRADTKYTVSPHI